MNDFLVYLEHNYWILILGLFICLIVQAIIFYSKLEINSTNSNEELNFFVEPKTPVNTTFTKKMPLNESNEIKKSAAEPEIDEIKNLEQSDIFIKPKNDN